MKKYLNWLWTAVLLSLFTTGAYGQEWLTEGYNFVVPDFQVDEYDSMYTFAKPCIAVKENGDFIVVWEDERDEGVNLYAQCILSDGTLSGSNYSVNKLNDNMDHYQPAIASDHEGNFVIAWECYNPDGDTLHWDILARRFSKDGVPMGECFEVSEKINSEYICEPAVAMDADGSFVITWRERRNNMNSDDIYVQRYDSNGTPLGSNLLVCDNSASQIYPDIDMDQQGNYVIAWSDERSGEFDIFAQRFFADGTKNGEIFQVSDPAPAVRKYDVSVSMNQQGDFIVVWNHGFGENDIYAQCYLADSSRSGENFQVNLDVSSEFRCSPSVDLNNDGRFVIAWHDDDASHDFYARCYSSNQKAINDPFRPMVSQTYMCHFIDLKLRNQLLYNVWNGSEGIYVNVIDLSTATEVVIDDNNVPSSFKLCQNYPNPFNPITTIDYSVVKRSNVRLSIYDINGRFVENLLHQDILPGQYKITWNAKDKPSGCYLIRFQTNHFETLHKCLLLK